uniref:Uncharacterized protein n=1 Tax=Arundo donax TaxID=35708 RepID=A0A0A8Y9W1_ARUDO
MHQHLQQIYSRIPRVHRFVSEMSPKRLKWRYSFQIHSKK